MLLLIPGPVSTRPEVRAAMRHDFAPWDAAFRPLYAGVCERIGVLAGCVTGVHAVLPLQGCGHFAVEAALRSIVPAGGRLLIPMTGSYAERMARLAHECGTAVVRMPTSDVLPVEPADVARALAADSAITHVGLVYSETSSGVVHPLTAVGDVVRAAGRRMVLDAVSAFGALPLDVAAHPEIDAAIFTANKCLEGVPGLAFVLARVDALRAASGAARSWSFDLRAGASPGRLAHGAAPARGRRRAGRASGALSRQCPDLVRGLAGHRPRALPRQRRAGAHCAQCACTPRPQLVVAEFCECPEAARLRDQ